MTTPLGYNAQSGKALLSGGAKQAIGSALLLQDTPAVQLDDALLYAEGDVLRAFPDRKRPPAAKKLGNIALLYTKPAGENIQYWLAGHSKTDELLATVPRYIPLCPGEDPPEGADPGNWIPFPADTPEEDLPATVVAIRDYGVTYSKTFDKDSGTITFEATIDLPSVGETATPFVPGMAITTETYNVSTSLGPPYLYNYQQRINTDIGSGPVPFINSTVDYSFLESDSQELTTYSMSIFRFVFRRANGEEVQPINPPNGYPGVSPYPPTNPEDSSPDSTPAGAPPPATTKKPNTIKAYIVADQKKVRVYIGHTPNCDTPANFDVSLYTNKEWQKKPGNKEEPDWRISLQPGQPEETDACRLAYLSNKYANLFNGKLILQTEDAWSNPKLKPIVPIKNATSAGSECTLGTAKQSKFNQPKLPEGAKLIMTVAVPHA